MDQGEVSRKNSEYESIIRQLRLEMGESGRKVGDYEMRITQFGLDLQQKNSEIERISRENQELLSRIQMLGDANRKVGEYESRINLLNQEI